MPCFIRAEAEDPVCVRHEAAQSRLAQTRGLGAGSAHARRRGDRHGTGTGPGGRDAIQGLPTSMQVRLAESKGKRPGLLLRTENHPAGNEIGFRCLLGARAPSQAQPPVQPVPRSGPAITSGAVTSGAVTSGAVTSGAVTSGAVTSGAVTSGTRHVWHPSRLAPVTSGARHVWHPSRLAPSGLALSRLALRRLDATPPPGAGQIITGQLPSGRPARCWTACRNLPRIRAMSTREIVTLRIPERGRPARITDQRLHRGVRSGACDGA